MALKNLKEVVPKNLKLIGLHMHIMRLLRRGMMHLLMLGILVGYLPFLLLYILYNIYLLTYLFVNCILPFEFLFTLVDENTSKKLNEILESEDSQANVKVNEILILKQIKINVLKKARVVNILVIKKVEFGDKVELD
ncbi:hypothetical protein RhiirC2_712353 [Rhizophagus irregularis]|uniref:Uncharacterized protein n=1 Tax=Rhizophagus irregularis TaxID=588596 RepID=A0A2N1N7J4_9GLOM|nr:hypothetical protein RhiirC2_712353 [Rhizophagus irregularis]